MSKKSEQIFVVSLQAKLSIENKKRNIPCPNNCKYVTQQLSF